MGVFAAVLLAVLGVVLFVLARKGKIRSETIQLATNVAGILAFIAAALVYIIPAAQTTNLFLSPTSTIAATLVLTAAVNVSVPSATPTVATASPSATYTPMSPTLTASPAAIAKPTDTPLPSSTPSPISTPTPTDTSQPLTALPLPTATQANVIFFDDFDGSDVKSPMQYVTGDYRLAGSQLVTSGSVWFVIPVSAQNFEVDTNSNSGWCGVRDLIAIGYKDVSNYVGLAFGCSSAWFEVSPGGSRNAQTGTCYLCPSLPVSVTSQNGVFSAIVGGTSIGPFSSPQSKVGNQQIGIFIQGGLSLDYIKIIALP